MRRLLYIPIIHSEADMGSAGVALAEQSLAMVGEGRWRLHQETVARFWDSIRAFLLTFDLRQLKVFQDGLAAGGERGRRIVAEAAARGSANYRLVLELLHGGAELHQTEDPALLLDEHQTLLLLTRPESASREPHAARQYQQRRDRLMESRDRFIAQAISATLGPGEVGVLFIGAYHSVASRLAKDIAVEAVKELNRVRAYHEELFQGHDDKRLEELAQYLASPVPKL